MRDYLKDDKEISAFEALYMWSNGLSSQTIAGVLRNKYDSTEGHELMLAALEALEVEKPNQNVEPANEGVGVVIIDVFNKNKQLFLDKIAEKLTFLTEPEKELLFTMTRSSLFDKARIDSDELKLSYNALYGMSIKHRDLINILRDLEKKGIIYCERPSYGNKEIVIIPDYVFSIQADIEATLFTVGMSKVTE